MNVYSNFIQNHQKLEQPKCSLTGKWINKLWYLHEGLPGGSMVKNPPANAGDAGNSGSIPLLGRSPGEGNGNPLQYSCWENPLEREAWMATVCGLAESETTEHACTLWNGKVIDNKKEQSTSWPTIWSFSLNWILLSARSQIQKVTYYMIPLNDIRENVYNFRDKKQISDCQGLVLGRETDWRGRTKGILE